jgi:hypothetical protein
MFLRNHDELTLEMVTDEERGCMYRVYTRSAMRINPAPPPAFDVAWKRLATD